MAADTYQPQPADSSRVDPHSGPGGSLANCDGVTATPGQEIALVERVLVYIAS